LGKIYFFFSFSYILTGGSFIVVKEGRRKRYIGFKIVFTEKKFRIKKTEIIQTIRKNCDNLFGEHCKQMGLFLLRFDGEQGIVRCRHTEKENTIDFLTSINEIKENKVQIETLGTSGTIKALVKKHMKDFEK